MMLENLEEENSMFKVSTKMRYGLRFLLDLASYSDQELISTREIAERQGLSNNYLRQLVMQLSKENIIGSARGKNGGVYLNRRPEDINMYDIYVLFEGYVALVDCVGEEFTCSPQSASCPAKKLWESMNSHIIKYLKSITLRDIMEESID